MADFWSDVHALRGKPCFVDAWHRAEDGETFHARHLAFESWDALARVLTNKRAAGLLETADVGLRADYDAIETKIAI